jgi:hypothetical protein
MRPAQLLDRFVGGPGKLNCVMLPSTLVLLAAAGVQADACGCSVGDNGYELVAVLKSLGGMVGGLVTEVRERSS